MAAAKRKLAKVAADDLVQRGLLNNRDVELTNARWVYFDYISKSGKKLDLDHRPVGLEATLIALDDATVVEQARWKIGDERYYEPEGASLYVVGDSDGAASKSSNFGIFIQSLADNGLPKELQEKLAEDASVLDGLKGHLVREKIPREGMDASGKPMKDGEVPKFSSIIAMPGKSAASKPSASKKSAGKAASKPVATDNGDIGVDDVAEFILTAIRQAGDELDVEALPGAAMSIMIAEGIPVDRRKALRDWIRDQGEDLTVDGMAFGAGKFALTE